MKGIQVRGLWAGIIVIVLGILVLAFPDSLRWIVGIGLIVIGILAIFRR